MQRTPPIKRIKRERGLHHHIRCRVHEDVTSSQPCSCLPNHGFHFIEIFQIAGYFLHHFVGTRNETQFLRISPRDDDFRPHVQKSLGKRLAYIPRGPRQNHFSALKIKPKHYPVSLEMSDSTFGKSRALIYIE